MGRTQRTTKRCACGGWRASDAERCAKCVAAAEAVAHNSQTPSRSADIEAALADECPERARFVEAVLARIAARKERANASR